MPDPFTPPPIVAAGPEGPGGPYAWHGELMEARARQWDAQQRQEAEIRFQRTADAFARLLPVAPVGEKSVLAHDLEVAHQGAPSKPLPALALTRPSSIDAAWMDLKSSTRNLIHYVAHDWRLATQDRLFEVISGKLVPDKLYASFDGRPYAGPD